MPLDFVSHVRAESARFATVLQEVDPASPVPSCPGWSAADLLWHLTDVQLFWGAIVEGRLQDPAAAEARKPSRPDTATGLSQLFDAASAALVEALGATPPDTPMWMWYVDGRNGGYIARRQAHEAAIHRLDAQLTAGGATPLDAELAADGIDEVLTIMHAPADWGTVLDSGPTGSIRTTDTDDGWTFRIAQFRGTDPESRKSYFEPVVQLESVAQPSFTVSGTASDLDAALWNRAALRDLRVTGDRDGFGALVDLIETGID